MDALTYSLFGSSGPSDGCYGWARRTDHRPTGTPSWKTGLFHDKAMAFDGIGPRIDLLNRGQGWVMRRLREALRRDLREMLTVLERNVQHCGELLIRE